MRVAAVPGVAAEGLEGRGAGEGVGPHAIKASASRLTTKDLVTEPTAISPVQSSDAGSFCQVSAPVKAAQQITDQTWLISTRSPQSGHHSSRSFGSSGTGRHE